MCGQQGNVNLIFTPAKKKSGKNGERAKRERTGLKAHNVVLFKKPKPVFTAIIPPLSLIRIESYEFPGFPVPEFVYRREKPFSRENSSPTKP
ncbi:hypothetical protein PanWU01x14_086100 [Parasponia andersonii]|uniref:Uncharacterized protein n=1 Tax=Parasponia andersonii TaxID=3476 RepID=A0A2P5D995_PARAD|nr:hypothetical protein PanWU01x14_086100 [Parasponia andersonii]